MLLFTGILVSKLLLFFTANNLINCKLNEQKLKHAACGSAATYYCYGYNKEILNPEFSACCVSVLVLASTSEKFLLRPATEHY